jgi:hypothetical protein
MDADGCMYNHLLFTHGDSQEIHGKGNRLAVKVPPDSTFSQIENIFIGK